jgi:hypothetical protein
MFGPRVDIGRGPFVVQVQPSSKEAMYMARFMLFIYPGISEEEYAAGPQLEDVEAMMRYNDELSKAGALLAGDGLHPEVSRIGSGGVIDGPFSEAKELVGGYWIIQAKDQAEAVEWATRCPLGPNDFIEVRRMVEVTDLSEELHAVASSVEPGPEQTTES